MMIILIRSSSNTAQKNVFDYDDYDDYDDYGQHRVI